MALKLLIPRFHVLIPEAQSGNVLLDVTEFDGSTGYVMTQAVADELGLMQRS